MTLLPQVAPSPPPSPPPRSPLHLATLLLLGLVVITAAIVAAWFAGEARITLIFQQLQQLQRQPPMLLAVPMVAIQFLLAPAILLMGVVYAITRLSPRPRPWSRRLVVGILLVLVVRYGLWRCLATLNLSSPLQGTFSLGLLAMELFGLVAGMIQLVLLLRVRDRKTQADLLEQDVLTQRYQPWVDIFIPTYDEPSFILRRTVIGCQAMDYPHARVYLLDDTRRPEIKALAEELGCLYLTRPHNHHAKAGNLNHALDHTSGELVACFDADFVPTRNFLRRTVGFFQTPQVGLVQTPQSFYNPDPIARNLGLEGVLTPEEEVFYRQIQPMRDGAGSVVCSGTSFVVRRSALEATGGFVTESLSEDYFTSVRLAAQGNEVIYLDEKLSAGLAAEDITTHAAQRLRWARGTLQAFFIDANPLTIPGLTPLQRLGHLEGLLHWFSGLPRIFFLLLPLAYSFLGVIPIQATTQEVLYFFLPYYLVQLTVFGWLNDRSRSALLSDIYALVLAFPLAATVLQAMIQPFSRGFRVTPKGTSSQDFQFRWGLAWPLLIMFGLTALSLWRNLGLCLAAGWGSAGYAVHAKGLALGWMWSAYNLAMLWIALLILVDVPRPDPHPWFDLRRVAQVSHRIPGADTVLCRWGITTMLSEVGAEIALTQPWPLEHPLTPGTPITVEMAEADLRLEGYLNALGRSGDFPTLHLRFAPLSLSQHRVLVEMLFCRPGQWKRWDSPGELQSLGLLIRLLLWPPRSRPTQPPIKALSVAKG